jgi:hypothetical protein
MSTDQLEKARVGGPACGLTKFQRSRMMVRFVLPAYHAMKARGLAGDDFEAWRREEQFKACHKESLRSATQADWNLLTSHFLRLSGRHEMAQVAALRATTEARRGAVWHLKQEMERCKDVIENPVDYLRAISRAKFKTVSSSDLSDKQLWVLVFDLRRAAQKKRAKRASPQITQIVTD